MEHAKNAISWARQEHYFINHAKHVSTPDSQSTQGRARKARQAKHASMVST